MPNIFYPIKVIAKIIARFSLFAVFFTFFSAFFSLASADSANNKITSIRYEGLQSLSAHLASEIADIKVGEALDEDKIDSAITDFYDQGYFSDIVAGFENGVLTFYFVEKPRVAGIEIKGYGSDNEKQTLQTQMGIKKGETFDEQKIERAQSLLKTVKSK